MLVAVNWAKLVPAALLLLPPVALLHGDTVHHRAVMRNWDNYWVRTFTLPLHALDFIRAAVGAWLLATALSAEGAGSGVARYLPLMIQEPVLLSALALQAMVCREPEAANAPFAFTLGLMAGYLPCALSGWMPAIVGGFALVPAVVIALGVRSPAMFFPIVGIALPAAGAIFKGKDSVPALGMLGFALLVPWLITLLFPRHFVVAYRASHPDSRPAR